MAIVVKHGKPETLITAARRAGEAQAAVRAQEQAEKLQAQQQEFEYRTAVRQQDMAIDLQMEERAKLWEIDKMELRSRLDFEREEKKRQQVLDQYEAIIKYIDDSDLFDEQQKEGLKFKAKMKVLNQNISGVDKILFPTTPKPRIPTPTQQVTAMKRLRTEEAYQEPSWLEKLLPGGKGELSPEILAERQIVEGIAAGKPSIPTGTITPALDTRTKTDYQLGEIIIRGGKQYKVVGFDSDGMPLVSEV